MQNNNMKTVLGNDTDVKISQVGFILLTIMTGSKFLNVPSSIASQAGRDGWISIIILFLIDFAVLLCLLWAHKLNKNNLSLNCILEKNLGKVGARPVYILFFVFFIVRQLDLMASVLNVFSATLTLKTNWPGFSIPIILLSLFIFVLGIRTFARTNQLVAAWVFISAFVMIVLSLTNTDFSEFTPVLADGFKPVGKAVLNHTFYFTDSLFIIFFLGRIKRDKNFFLSPITAFILGTLLTLFLYVVFYALFGEIAWLQDSAMPKVSQFNTQLTVNGRLDWLALLLWLTAIFLKIVLFAFCSIYSLQGIIRKKDDKPNIFSFIFYTAIVLMLPILLPVSSLTEYFAVRAHGQYTFWVIQYVIPFLMPIFVYRANRYKKQNKNKETAYDTI